METLLIGIVGWLSLGFGLPANYALPRIEFASAARMESVQLRGQRPASSQGAATEDQRPAHRNSQRQVEALYDDSSRTIYLPEGWTSKTPAEVSALVHEMVHHLQNQAGLKYDCPQAREKLAYVAQDRWLARSGRNLLDEFKLDALTVLLRTKCMH